MQKKTLLIIVAVATLGFSCKKAPGDGGTSSIKGTVRGQIVNNQSDPSAEVTTVTCTVGAVIDDNTYWLLNSPNGNLYYIWYDNTNWLGNDPALSGRTGIQVIYDFNQSNTTIANNTMTAIQGAVGSDFSLSLTGDIITITANNVGEVADAENLDVPFGIDVQTQGGGGGVAVIGNAIPIIDERVYLVYGDEDFYSESVRTDGNGFYQFKGLNKGDYKVYAFSKDTTNASGIDKMVEVEVSIAKNKEVVEASELFLFK